MENEEEIAAFWDDFAEEYEAIQKESVVPLAETIKDYLLEEKILPTSSFLDLAGGTGKFLPAFEPYVKNYTLVDISQEMLAIARKKACCRTTTFLCQSQQEVFRQSKTYKVVFSAMNPALQTEEQVLNFLNLGDIRLILRIIEDSDTLFSPYEPSFQEGLQEKLMESYKKILRFHKIPFKSRIFPFFVEEKISITFFQMYFKNILTEKDLNQLLEKHFQDRKNTMNTRTITYELLQF